jgi:hypothetical protein
MVNSSGTITLNGITDKELAKIWEVKARLSDHLKSGHT